MKGSTKDKCTRIKEKCAGIKSKFAGIKGKCTRIKESISNSAFWLFCVAVFAGVPLLLTVTYKWYSGDNIESLICEHFPDFILIVSALSTSIFYDIACGSKRKWALLIVFLSIAISFSAYFFFYFTGITSLERLKPIGIATIVVYGINILLGISMKWRIHKLAD